MNEKDVYEYFDRVQKTWERLGCRAESVHDEPLLQYEVGPDRRSNGRGHLIAHLMFPDFPNAYLDVQDYLVPEPGHIRREYYAYDLIVDGARLENWHRHPHFPDHCHDPANPKVKHLHPRTTLEDALRMSLEILWSGAVPGE